MPQVKVHAKPTKGKTEPVAEETTAPECGTPSVVDQATDWLEEIDEALAENVECALEFWMSFRQKGGQ